MNKMSGRILKANDVKIQGSCHLDIGQMGRKPQKTVDVHSNSKNPQVRIIEKNECYAILEVTCSCGVKTSIRCEYDDNATN